ncbi:MAG: enoyl-CoA hydratase/isomerase family protein [Marinobacter sp.]
MRISKQLRRAERGMKMTDLPQCTTILLDRVGSRLNMTLNRPERRNAINNEMGVEFNSVVEWLHDNPEIRLVVLRGAGGHFCAGGDIKERRSLADNDVGTDEDPIMARNMRAGMGFLRFAHLPQTTIAMVEGSAFGGGMGYACLADITIVVRSARMGMPETALGVAPAQIAPHVVKRVGLTRARQLALTGERFDGQKALEYGVAQYLCDDDEVEATLESVVAQVLKGAPQASAVTKEIMRNVGTLSDEEMVRFSAERFAELNRGDEGREGQAAFAEKRPPAWQVTNHD